MALVAAVYVAAVIVLVAQGDGIAAAYLTVPASMPVLRLLYVWDGVAPGLASSEVVQACAIAGSAIVNAGCAFGVARLLVARW
jgi:hypothetical protein